MSWQEIIETYGGTIASRKKQAQRLGVSKDEFVSMLQTDSVAKTETRRHKKINETKTEDMTVIKRQPFAIRRYTDTSPNEVEVETKTQSTDNQWKNVSIFDENPESILEDKFEDLSLQGQVETGVKEEVDSEDIQKVAKHDLVETLQQPAAQVVTVIKSDILAVTAMLVLSVLIAMSFTAKIFIASGVVPIAAYVMSILLDFTMIVFVFRGHTQIAWLFGVNVFAQVALTTSARMFLSFMSESTLVGIKGLLVAFSIVIAIKGLSDFVQQNFK